LPFTLTHAFGHGNASWLCETEQVPFYDRRSLELVPSKSDGAYLPKNQWDMSLHERLPPCSMTLERLSPRSSLFTGFVIDTTEISGKFTSSLRVCQMRRTRMDAQEPPVIHLFDLLFWGENNIMSWGIRTMRTSNVQRLGV
jgi:hypothetical protein